MKPTDSLSKRNNGEPLYLQMRRIFLEHIQSGKWKPSEPIPSEAALCKEYGVSRSPVRWALQSLENDGLLYRLQGRGSFVATPERIGAAAIHSIQQTLWAATGYAMPRLIRHSQSINDQKLLSWLNLPSSATWLSLDAPLVRLERTYHYGEGEAPSTLLTSFLPLALTRGIDFERLKTNALATLLAERGYPVARSAEWMNVGLADDDEAAAMQLERPAPILILTELRHSPNGVPLCCSRFAIRGDSLSLYFSTEDEKGTAPTYG